MQLQGTPLLVKKLSAKREKKGVTLDHEKDI